jgi:ATP-dependent protease ClpP protease subunit
VTRPRSPEQVRQFLNRRVVEPRPRNAVPDVTINGTTATLRLYDPIDDWGEGWGMSAAELAKALDSMPASVTTIELLLNSPGGFVHEAFAMMAELDRHPARTVAVVTGLAASAATFLACSADELVMAPQSELMIHDVWMVAIGDAAHHRQIANELDRMSDQVADLYARKAGGRRDRWRDLMRAETWYTAEQAVAAGLADRVGSSANRATASNWRSRMDLDALELLALPEL